MHGAYRQACFLKGVARLAALPADVGAEVAFAGRSNAGKSSVINALTGRAALARISKTPGRTQQLNFFVLDDDQRRLVDLPGYGYANVPIAVKRRWAALVEGYLRSRRSLMGVVLLMDARRPFTDADSQLVDWCAHAGLATQVLLNKADKLSRGAAARTLTDARKRLAPFGEQHLVQLFSATRRTGIDALGARLDAWLGYAPAAGWRG
jgi:GTP-binding protein